MAESSRLSLLAAQLTDEQLLEIAQRRGLTLTPVEQAPAANAPAKSQSRPSSVIKIVAPSEPALPPTWGRSPEHEDAKKAEKAKPAVKGQAGSSKPRKEPNPEKFSKMRTAFLSQIGKKGGLHQIAKICAEEEHVLHDEPPKKAPKAIQISVVTPDAGSSQPLWGSSVSTQDAHKSNLKRALRGSLKSGDLTEIVDTVSSAGPSSQKFSPAIQDNRKSLAERFADKIRDNALDKVIAEVEEGEVPPAETSSSQSTSLSTSLSQGLAKKRQTLTLTAINPAELTAMEAAPAVPGTTAVAISIPVPTKPVANDPRKQLKRQDSSKQRRTVVESRTAEIRKVYLKQKFMKMVKGQCLEEFVIAVDNDLDFTAPEVSSDEEERPEEIEETKSLPRMKCDTQKKRILADALFESIQDSSLKTICNELDADEVQKPSRSVSRECMSNSKVLKKALTKLAEEGRLIEVVADEKVKRLSPEEELAQICAEFENEFQKPWPKNHERRRDVLKMRFLAGLSDGKLNKVLHRVKKYNQSEHEEDMEHQMEKAAMKSSVKHAFQFGASNRALERTIVAVGSHFGIGLKELNLQKKLVANLDLLRLDDICAMVKGQRMIGQWVPPPTMDLTKKIDMKESFIKGLERGDLHRIVTHVAGEDQAVGSQGSAPMIDLLKESLISGVTSGALDEAIESLPKEEYIWSQLRPASLDSKKQKVAQRFEDAAESGKLQSIMGTTVPMSSGEPGKSNTRSWWKYYLPGMLNDGRLDMAILKAKKKSAQLAKEELSAQLAKEDVNIALASRLKKKLAKGIEDGGFDEIILSVHRKKEEDLKQRKSNIRAGLVESIKDGGLDEMFLQLIREKEKDWSAGFSNLLGESDSPLLTHRNLIKESLLQGLQSDNLGETFESCRQEPKEEVNYANLVDSADADKLEDDGASSSSSHEVLDSRFSLAQTKVEFAEEAQDDSDSLDSETATTSTENDVKPISTIRPGDLMKEQQKKKSMAKKEAEKRKSIKENASRASLFNPASATALLGPLRPSIRFPDSPSKGHIRFEEVDPFAVTDYLNFVMWRYFVRAPPKVGTIHRRIPRLADMLNRLHMVYHLEAVGPDARRKNHQLATDNTMSVYEELWFQKRMEEAQFKTDTLDKIGDLSREIEVTQSALAGLVEQFPDAAPRCAPRGEWPPPCKLTQPQDRIIQTELPEYRPTSPIRNKLFPVSTMTTILRGEQVQKNKRNAASMMMDASGRQDLKKAMAAAKDQVEQEERFEEITLDSSRVSDSNRDSSRRYDSSRRFDSARRDGSPSPKKGLGQSSGQMKPGDKRFGVRICEVFYSTSTRPIAACISTGTFITFEGDAIINASQWPKMALDSQGGWSPQGSEELAAKYKNAISDIDCRGPRSVGLLMLDSSMLQGTWSLEHIARLGCEAINTALCRSSNIQEVHFLAKTDVEEEALLTAVSATFRRSLLPIAPSPRSKAKIEKWMKNPLAPRSFKEFPDLDPPMCPKIVKIERHPWRPAKAQYTTPFLGLSAGGALAEINLPMSRAHVKNTYTQSAHKPRDLRPTVKPEARGVHDRPFR